MNNLRNTKSFLLLLNTCAFSLPVCNFCNFFPCIPYGHLVDVTGTCSVAGSITRAMITFHIRAPEPLNSYSCSWREGRGGSLQKENFIPEKQHKTILTISIRMPGYSVFRTILAGQGCLDLLCGY